MVKRQRSFDGRGGVGWREKYVKEGLKICYYIKHLRQRNKQGKKYLEGTFS